MKIGIITKIGKNYGALLQAYALRKCCEELGADSYIIRYSPHISEKSYKICKFPWRVKGSIANLKALRFFRENIKSTHSFYKFREKYFNFIGNYRTYEEILSYPPICEIYITGSDQVWNPEISFDKAFYCTFVPQNKKNKLASYAASIGINKIPIEFENEFKNRIKNFNYISVREKQGQKILKEMGIDSIVAPDPTLLFKSEEWNEIAIETIKGPYILCYFVSFPKEIKNLVEEIQKKLNYKVVNILLSEESSAIGDIKIRTAGPQEFLGLFKNAEFVITSSYHGTIFSILNRKPFVSTLYKKTSSRVTELLANLGLENRIVQGGEMDIEKYLFSNLGEIYTTKVEKKLEEMRKKGRVILKEIMELDNV